MQDGFILPPLRRNRRSITATVVMCACALYLLCLLGAWGILRFAADEWWPATVLLFAPRWTLGLPLILLIPFSLAAHRRSLITLAAAGAVLIWPILELRIPMHSSSDDGNTPFLRVVTCNVHRQQLSTAEFKSVLDEVRPDLVVLQDWSSTHEPGLFNPGSWNVRRDGELFVASRYPIVSAAPIPLEEPPPAPFVVRLGAAAYYRIETPLGPLDVINLHLASPHEALGAMMHFDPTSPEQLTYNTRCRDMESATIEKFARGLNGNVVILGDFNTPRQSALYREYWDQFADAFYSSGFGFGSSHVSTLSSVRIDHILTGPAWESRSCWLAHPSGSPHRPLVADLLASGQNGSVATDAGP